MATPWGVTTCSPLRSEAEEVARWSAFVRAGHCTRMALPSGRDLHRIARHGGEVVVRREPLSPMVREGIAALRTPDLGRDPFGRWGLWAAALWVPGKAGAAHVDLPGFAPRTAVGQLLHLVDNLPAGDALAEALRAGARFCLRHDLVLQVGLR